MAGPTLSAYLGLNRFAGASGGLKIDFPANITVSAELTVAATTHAAGTIIGGKALLASAVLAAAGGGIVQGAIWRDADGNEVPLELFLFDSDLEGEYDDGDPFVLTIADLARCVGVIQFAGMSKGGTCGVISMPAIGLPFKLASGTTLYAVPVARMDATFTGTPAVSFVLSIIPG